MGTVSDAATGSGQEGDPRGHEGTGDRASAPFRHVPVRSLSARHRPRILTHLMALPEADRYLRFGYAASDAQLAHYVDLIDFAHDEVFGIRTVDDLLRHYPRKYSHGMTVWEDHIWFSVAETGEVYRVPVQ